MKSTYKILADALNKKGYVIVDFRTCSNQVAKFLEKNDNLLKTEIVTTGVRISLK